MTDSINKQTREVLTQQMRKLQIEINNTVLPLLNPSISQIVIDVNNGEVAKIRPQYIVIK